MKFSSKFIYERLYGQPHWTWLVVGRKGAVHFHVSDCGKENGEKYGQRYSGGLEIHYREPPSYMADHAPSQNRCWVLKCPCWHDGTSLYASERVIPFWLSAPDDHERIFRFLEHEYMERFAGDGEP